jgi:putative FmdB family regulatory protein
MPVYTYRREDGTTFDIRQKFSEEPLAIDPDTGQKVVRLVQSAGIIFKGSGFYVTDNKGAANGRNASKNGDGSPNTTDSPKTEANGTGTAKNETASSAKPSEASSSAAD